MPVVRLPDRVNETPFLFDVIRRPAARVVRMERSVHLHILAKKSPEPIFIDLNNGFGPQVYFTLPEFHPEHRETLTAIYPDDRGDHVQFEPVWLDSRMPGEFIKSERFLRSIREDLREIVFDRILSRGGLFIDAMATLIWMEDYRFQMDNDWWITRAIHETLKKRKEIRAAWHRR